MSANGGEYGNTSNHAPLLEISEFCTTHAKAATTPRKALAGPWHAQSFRNAKSAPVTLEINRWLSAA